MEELLGHDITSSEWADFELFKRSADAHIRNLETEVYDQITPDLLSQATWHQTGFLVMRLAMNNEDSQLWQARLHVWPSGFERLRSGDYGIHKHRFDLHSLILAGVYSEILYSTEPAGFEDEGSLAGYMSNYGDAEDQFKQVAHKKLAGHLLLNKEGTNDYPAGTSHSVIADVYHSTEIDPANFAVTLMATGPDRGYAPVHIGAKSNYQTRDKRPQITPQETEAVWAQLETAFNL